MELTNNVKNIVKKDLNLSNEHVKVKIHRDSDIASKAISDYIIEKINQKVKTGEAFVLGLATGSSPIKVYRNLIHAYKNSRVSFKNVYTFNLDEYFPMDSSSIHSYVQFMHQNLFNEIDIPKENIHIPDGSLPLEKIEAYCTEYEKKISELGGIDLQLLGIGRTGHIGFNEPNASFESETRLVWLDPLTRKDASSSFFGEKNVPTQAITMGMKTIMQSKEIILLAWGESKVSILQKTIEGNVTKKIPATLLQKHNN
ncbi:glucosamine-6-phosphate deaminase, partial [Flavobacteriaceae bacterium]|nr:glucosamine-6-phosphate deaminase [Flavobacteriaceae bacterium]